jgi:hypothetical protein
MKDIKRFLLFTILAFMCQMGFAVDDTSGASEMPKGAVVAFNLEECPPQWKPYVKAYGRFIRGIDLTKTTPDQPGYRTLGSPQDDAMQGHTHSTNAENLSGNGNIQPGKAIGKRAAASVGNPIDDGKNGTPRVASETRPVNVALLYCEKR